jgi:hypothetical protein
MIYTGNYVPECHVQSNIQKETTLDQQIGYLFEEGSVVCYIYNVRL